MGLALLAGRFVVVMAPILRRDVVASAVEASLSAGQHDKEQLHISCVIGP